LLPVALLATALLEIIVFLLVGNAIGYGWAVLLVFAASAAGVLLLRREGMRAWRGFRAAAQEGRPPGDQVTDGVVGLGAAVLLAIPGLVTGLIGLLLVLPLRRPAKSAVRRLAERRVSSAVAGDLFGPRRVRVRRGAPTGEPPAGPSYPPAAPTGTINAGPATAGPGTAGPGPSGPSAGAPSAGTSGAASQSGSRAGTAVDGDVIEGEIV
jgi:UPF0716 protein FxsA